MFLYTHNIIAGALLEIAGWAGFLINIFIIYKVVSAKLFGKAFGRIWISRGIAHVFESLLFVLFFGPVAIVDPFLFDLLFAQRIHHLIYCFRFAIFATNLLIAINRAVMVCKPLLYKVLFSYQRTILLVMFTWVISIASGVVNFVDPCQQTAMNSSMNYYEPRSNCNILLHVYDVGFPPACFIATAIIDELALFKLYSLPQLRKEFTNASNASQPNRAKEIRLCYMIMVEVITAGMTIISIRFGFIITNLGFEFLGFLFTSWAWGMSSAFDGIIVVIFNTEMHTLRTTKRQHSNSPEHFRNRRSNSLSSKMSEQKGPVCV
ncbi:hypothetical protein L596_012557 [Steinernema carpocapsae]|uniref:G-protein coupled receptors family 1 profile domain-containing protein n=1 Tax=Steinernema carpocapsae TaxID=34508 RepID=A0A4V6A4U1_STECR|nr:hypothetical protein L596_012557 [Steinernema carpocapsae]